MKRIKYYLAALVSSVLLLSSCSDSFFDINTDPNNPAKSTPALVLPSAISGSAYVMGGYYQAIGGFWSQQYAQSSGASQWAEWESYNLTEGGLDRQFSTLYAGSLQDYEYVRKNAAESGNWAYYSIATIMQAYTFQVLADLYDQVPFTEALKGLGNLQPKYNNGELIYDSLLVRIDDALSKDFTAKTSQNPGKSDMIFGGDMDKWIQFANTLKLKMYLRYVKVDVTTSAGNRYKAQIQALLAKNSFLTTDAKFSAFKDETTGGNPFWNTFGDRLTGNVVANNTLMNYLTSNADPRKTKLFNAAATGGSYTGIDTGDSKNHPTLTIANYATPTLLTDHVAPVYFFSSEEALFLVAEAQARYGTAVDAETTYKAAINASLISLGLPSGGVTYQPYDGIKSIIVQKWIAATNKRSLESFFDYNRTGYPDNLSTSKTSVFNGADKPKRLFFPSSEQKSNANTPTKVALTVPVWWAK
jgi:hypothetical protein